MDTCDLTEMAYETIWIIADRNDFLRCELGCMVSEYKEEDAYLLGVLEFMKEIEEKPECFLDDWNIGNEYSKEAILADVKEIAEHARRTLETPMHERTCPKEC